MFQIVYISFAAESFKSDGIDGIDNILKGAYAFNAKKDITGMLLYKGGVFIQLLEGEKKEVESLFGKIALDLRHEGLKVLIKQESQERVFKDWTMGYRKIDKIETDIINSILPLQKIIEDTNARRTISNEKIFEIFKRFRFQ
jgi:hypothetical protein